MDALIQYPPMQRQNQRLHPHHSKESVDSIQSSNLSVATFQVAMSEAQAF